MTSQRSVNARLYLDIRTAHLLQMVMVAMTMMMLTMTMITITMQTTAMSLTRQESDEILCQSPPTC